MPAGAIRHAVPACATRRGMPAVCAIRHAVPGCATKHVMPVCCTTFCFSPPSLFLRFPFWLLTMLHASALLNLSFTPSLTHYNLLHQVSRHAQACAISHVHLLSHKPQGGSTICCSWL